MAVERFMPAGISTSMGRLSTIAPAAKRRATLLASREEKVHGELQRRRRQRQSQRTAVDDVIEGSGWNNNLPDTSDRL
jgi:hypothetical protein